MPEAHAGSIRPGCGPRNCPLLARSCRAALGAGAADPRAVAKRDEPYRATVYVLQWLVVTLWIPVGVLVWGRRRRGFLFAAALLVFSLGYQIVRDWPPWLADDDGIPVARVLASGRSRSSRPPRALSGEPNSPSRIALRREAVVATLRATKCPTPRFPRPRRPRGDPAPRALALDAMIHHANPVRPNVDGLKVGGHQASSASVVSILTAF